MSLNLKEFGSILSRPEECVSLWIVCVGPYLVGLVCIPLFIDYLFFYCSLNITGVIKSRGMRWVGYVTRVGERRCLYRVLVGKLEGKKPLGRTRHRWEDNIEMDLQEVRCGGMNWFKLAQGKDRWQELVNEVMNLRFPQNVGNFLTG